MTGPDTLQVSGLNAVFDEDPPAHFTLDVRAGDRHFEILLARTDDGWDGYLYDELGRPVPGACGGHDSVDIAIVAMLGDAIGWGYTPPKPCELTA